MRYLKLYMKYVNVNLRALMAYKTDFLVSFFAGLLSQTIGLLFLFVLFQNIPSVAGWNLYEVAVLYGLMYFSEGILTLFFQGTNGLKYHVRNGDFDRYMLRPLPITFQVYAAQTNLAGAGTAVTGLAVMIYAFVHLGTVFPVWKILFLIASLAVGIFIRLTINYTASAVTFWFHGMGGITDGIYKVQDMAKYPIGIYPKGIRAVLLSVLPFAAISYVPAAVLLDRRPPTFELLMLLGAGIIFAIQEIFLSRSLNRYESTGN